MPAFPPQEIQSDLPTLPFALDARLEKWRSMVWRGSWESFPTGIGPRVDSVFSKPDIVGIKITARLGNLSMQRKAAEIVCEALIQKGIAPDHIIIWDWRNADVSAAGFTLNTGGGAIRCFGVEDVFDKELLQSGAICDRVSMIVSRICTALISVAPVCRHPLEGVNGCVRALYDALWNPHKCNATLGYPFAADLLGLEPIRSKWRLGVALHCEEILVSTDPVALDAVAWRRSAAPGEAIPNWLLLAESYGYGSINATEKML